MNDSNKKILRILGIIVIISVVVVLLLRFLVIKKKQKKSCGNIPMDLNCGENEEEKCNKFTDFKWQCQKVNPLKQVIYGVPYDPKREYNMDIYIPKSPNGKGLLLVHGGGLVKGSRSAEREVSISLDFVAKGFNVFSMDYKIGNNSYPENITSVLHATNFINTYYKDLEMSIIGLSAGATLVLTSVLKHNNLNEYFRNVISLYGITSPLDRTYIDDKENHGKGEFRSGHMHDVLGTSRCVSCKSKTPHYKKDKKYCKDTDSHKRKLHCVSKVWKDFSPVENINKDTRIKNIILVQGMKDKIVNPEQPSIFKNKVNKVIPRFINNIKTIFVEEGAHGFDLKKNRDGTDLYKDPKQLINSILLLMK
jgi:hypothetical protein